MTVLPSDNKSRFASHQPIAQFSGLLSASDRLQSNSHQIGDFFSQQGTLGVHGINVMAFDRIRANTLVF